MNFILKFLLIFFMLILIISIYMFVVSNAVELLFDFLHTLWKKIRNHF